MSVQNEAIVIYLAFLIIALIMGEPATAGFVILAGLLVLAMYQYGGERLRKILRELLLK